MGLNSEYHRYLIGRASEYHRSAEYAAKVETRRKQARRNAIRFVLEWSLGVVLVGVGVVSAILLLDGGFAILPAIGLAQGLVVGRAMASAILFG